MLEQFMNELLLVDYVEGGDPKRTTLLALGVYDGFLISETPSKRERKLIKISDILEIRVIKTKEKPASLGPNVSYDSDSEPGNDAGINTPPDFVYKFVLIEYDSGLEHGRTLVYVSGIEGPLVILEGPRNRESFALNKKAILDIRPVSLKKLDKSVLIGRKLGY